MDLIRLNQWIDQFFHGENAPADPDWAHDIRAWQLLRWEADTPLNEKQRAALLSAACEAMALCGGAATMFEADAPDDLLLLVCHTRFPAGIHRATAMWLCGHLLIDLCNENAEQEGTLFISEEFHTPEAWRGQLGTLNEAHRWWEHRAPMDSSSAHKHRTSLQTILKRRQFASMGGYVTRALRGAEEPGILCFGFVPIVIEAIWSQTADVSLHRLTANLDLKEMTRRPKDALLAWLRSLAELLRACPPISEAQPIRRVIAAIEADCSLPYSQINLSRSIGVTPAYFCRLFQEETGQHFSSYLTRVRMSRAQELLREGGRSLAEISQLCGYPNKSYFCQVFKRHTGLTPGEYEAAASAKAAAAEE